MSRELTAQAFATSLLEQWGGNVQKEAFLKKTPVGKAISKGVGSVVGKIGKTPHALRIKANQAPGNPTEGFKSYAKGGLRSLSGIKPGDKGVTGPVSAAYRTARTIVAPNLGTGLNSLRGVGLVGYGSYKGVQGYNAVGETAEAVRDVSHGASLAGAPMDVLSDINQYTTRGGIAKGWLRGHGAPSWMTKQRGYTGTVRQRLLDEIMAGTADDLTFNSLTHSFDKGIKFHEALNPGGAILSRTIQKGVGEANAGANLKDWREQIRTGLRDIMNAGKAGGRQGFAREVKVQGSDLKSGLRVAMEQRKKRRLS